jgi:hypothetical protein
MDSMDNVRKRIAALEQQMNVMGAHTRTVERRRRWWRGIGLLVSLLGLCQTGQAADFTCPTGDGACLIAAMTTANANGDANTISLEGGTYTLTAVDNTTEGPTGLPSVTSTLTIQGAGADTTSIERSDTAPAFRLLHVATTGRLTLKRLTLRGGEGSFFGFISQNGGGLLPDKGLRLQALVPRAGAHDRTI